MFYTDQPKATGTHVTYYAL